jgi:hypothetical protein
VNQNHIRIALAPNTNACPVPTEMVLTA